MNTIQKKEEKTDVKVGDIVLYSAPKKKPWWGFVMELQTVFDGKCVHAEIIASKELTTEGYKYFSVSSEGVGVLNHKPVDITRKDICIVRVKDLNINSHSFGNTVMIWYGNLVEKSHGKKPSYSWFGVMKAGLWKGLQVLSFNTLRRTSILPDDAMPFCSEAVAELLYKDKGFRFKDKNGFAIADNLLTPSDIYESDQVFKIKEFN